MEGKEIEKYGWVRQAMSNDCVFEQCADEDAEFVRIEHYESVCKQNSQLQLELEKAKELLKEANQLLWDGLRNDNELVPFPTRSKVDEITTFLEGSGNKTK